MPSSARVEVAKELLDKLPRTFLPVLNQQLKDWDLLFPAEQRPIRATLDYLGRLDDSEREALLSPVKALEKRMNLPGWTAAKDHLGIEDTSVLARSPLYPEWRVEVEKLFDNINASVELPKSNKVVVSVLPAGLPLESAPLWPNLARRGRWIQLDRSFRSGLDAMVTSLARRPAAPDSEPVEHTWVLESVSHFSELADSPNWTVLSYEALAAARNEFRRRMNEIEKDLRSADETFDALRHVKIEMLLGPHLEADRRIREFIRALFLSGNGAVLFNNSFVQWGASEILRRAEPQALVCCFGIRPKLKPFSSLVLFEDQERANPVKEEPDPAGSLVDIQLLCDYVFLTTERLSNYEGRTLHIFAAADSDVILVVAPPSFPSLPSHDATVANITDMAISWLAA
ncbi:MAG: hypothetical protein KIT09_07805 [Bryobacteraceae bacterium]|nr:hypothetical protein [Bryobacteraceae bacterium]